METNETITEQTPDEQLANVQASNEEASQPRSPSMPMRFHSIEMVGVGPFEQQRIEFPPCPSAGKAEIHIFTGVNGCGKSTVLRALAGAFFRQALDGRFHIADTSLVDYEFEPTLGRKLRLSLLKGQARHIASQEDDWYTLDGFRFSDWINHVPIHLARFLNGEFTPIKIQSVALAYSGSRSAGVISSPNMLAEVAGFADNPFSDILDFSSYPNSKSLAQWLVNAMVRANYVMLGKREHETREKEIAVILQQKHHLEQTIFEITGLNVGFLYNPDAKEVRFDIGGKELRFDILPDGLKSIIGWLADVFMRLDRLPWIDDIPLWERSFILLLDEIEIHLHPKWQREILPVLQRLFPNAQIFVATHSPFVVASVHDAWVHKLDVQDGKARLVETQPSLAGHSYLTAIDEVFGITSYFDVVTEKQLQYFKEVRNFVLKGHWEREEELLSLARTLANNGEELANIVVMELKQMEKITGKKYSL